jgi:hypothetical protein
MEKDWVCVLNTEQSFQAEMAKEILENDEIECVILNERDTAFPTLGEIGVWVHQDFESKAKELLKELSH